MKKGVDLLLNRAVEQVVSREELKKKLLSGKKLRVKLGIDPTADTIHLGNAVVLWKLREFQDLGHKAVLIIGDFTARIGDPSDKKAVRKVLSESQIKKNMGGYLKQASLILDPKKLEVRYNSEWLLKLKLGDFIKLAQLTTVNQLLERDIFERRRRKRKPVFLHEILYPPLQAYDSVAVKADVELGGTDQTFNLLFGRALMAKLGLKPQEILTCPLLVGLDGKAKMSKSSGNFIGVTEKADEIYGKIMSLPDRLILSYAELAARFSQQETDRIKARLRRENPRDIKMELAKSIVVLYHGKTKAQAAQKEFRAVFQKRELPQKIKLFAAPSSPLPLISLLVSASLVASKSEARRLIAQGGVKLNGKKIIHPQAKVRVGRGSIVQVGKRRFAQVGRILAQ